MKTFALISFALALSAGAAASAQAQIVHAGPAGSPIASVVLVPAGYDTAYVSGMTPPVIDANAPKGSPAAFGDTKTQTIGVIKRLEEALKGQGMDLGDVVMMRVYLAGDPAKGGKMDFAGMMEGYKMFFGTPEQPNKPARVTTEVAALVGTGQMVEIEVQAAKKR